VRFKNQGLDAIEVQDNGSGISPQNYDSLALKHHTSKLSTYADLNSLQTFGFRGEALSSLCALSDFAVVTCLAADVPKGTRLAFASSGAVQGTSVVAAQKGTTVIVENLFKNLPVRRRELERNIKREWSKVINLLNQYACVQTGLKFTVSQQPNKGKRIVLFSTKGNTATRDNIINVFGAKTMAALITLDLSLRLDETGVASTDGSSKVVRVQGHVSRPAHGEGRQTPDRQMFYVNGRPCQLPQFAKIFNEVYKSHNTSQSPFIFADIQLDTHLYDVNVSPDKRTILLHDQGRMLDTLRENLAELFEMQDVTVPVSRLSGPFNTSFKPMAIGPRDNTTLDDTEDEHSASSSASSSSSEDVLDRGGQTKSSTRGKTLTRPVNASKRSGKVGLANNTLGRWVERSSNITTDAANETQCPSSELISENANKLSDTEDKGSSDAQESDGAGDEDTARELRRSGTDSGVTGDDESTVPPEILATPCVSKSGDGNSVGMRPVAPDLPIPALDGPSWNQTTLPDRISPRRNPKYAQTAVATITVGDETITSIIGSSTKRPRLGVSPKTSGMMDSASKAELEPPLPSFGSRLSQMFAAQTSMDTSESNRAGSPKAHGPIKSSSQEIDDDEENDGLGEESAASDASDDPGATASGPFDNLDEEHDTEQGGSPLARDEDDTDSEYLDKEEEKKTKEMEKVQALIEAAQQAADNPTDDGEKRSNSFVKGATKKKDITYQYEHQLKCDDLMVGRRYETWLHNIKSANTASNGGQQASELDAQDAEEKLSLIISKADFSKMRIVGQFNLGFILAVRETDGSIAQDDELFIIDQHASDEKYNFERLQTNTVVQSQRLVRPKQLELTALEEEILIENKNALDANGFVVKVDESGDTPVGARCQLLSLPLSRETTFSLADLEELISLLGDHAGSTVPRPSRVRKMFAMRACRSSIMIGKPLSVKQMQRVVQHMGEMEKPWNCPHGRPTMRHLCSLGAWDSLGWREDAEHGEPATSASKWAEFLGE
jgi:DNA mismatch repair protein PMS2